MVLAPTDRSFFLEYMPHFSHKPPFRNLGGGFCCHVFQLAKAEVVFLLLILKAQKDRKLTHFWKLPLSAFEILR